MLRIGDTLRFNATGEKVKVLDIQIMPSDGSDLPQPLRR